MGFVYKYIDTDDEIVKYVGIVWATDNICGLKRRIRDHLSDDWNKLGNWRIEYISESIQSRTDAEYFEAHYISLYDTGKYFNKSKVGWGKSNFLPLRNDWNILDLSFLSGCNNIKKQKDPIYITRYDVASKLIYKRKSNKYFINESGINLLINGLIMTIDNDFYYDEDNGFLYFISDNGFKEKEQMQNQSNKYTINTDNKKLFTKYVYNLIGGGDDRILQAEYGYI